jgi:hypothetical protein
MGLCGEDTACEGTLGSLGIQAGQVSCRRKGGRRRWGGAVLAARGKRRRCSLAEGALGKRDASSSVESADVVCVAEDAGERQGCCGGGVEAFGLVGYDALVLKLLLLHHAARAPVCSCVSVGVCVCLCVCVCVCWYRLSEQLHATLKHKHLKQATHTHMCVCVCGLV